MSKNNKKPNKNNIYIIVLCIFLIVAVALVIALYFMNQNSDKKENIPYTQLIKDIEEDKIEKIEMTVGSTTLKLTYKERENEEDTETAIIPNTQVFMEYINEKKLAGSDIELEQKSSGNEMNISNDEMIDTLIDIETQYSNRLVRLEIDYFNIDTRKLDEELSYDLDNEKTLNKILEDENASDEIKDCIKIYREAADLSHELYKLEKIGE